MRFYFTLLFSIITICGYSQNKKSHKIKKGKWLSELKLNDVDVLPFNMTVTKDGGFIVENAEERIFLEPAIYKNDSLCVKFPFFNSELVFAVNNKKSLSGYWVNYNKGDNYKIPFMSIRKKTPRFSFIQKNESPQNINGKWKVEFEPNTNTSYPAIGVFNQADGDNSVSGTFLTETGDYRYLEGNTTSDSLFLSCFDGSHAFLFKASYKGDSLFGNFYSGNHWKSSWVAVKNDTFELKSPEKITYLVDQNPLNLDLKLIDGSTFSFPNKSFDNKVVILQIMGSWCPNCLDEVIYYKQLHDKYHKDGLEIISVCYEAGDSFEDYVSSIHRLKNKLNLDFTFVVGGAAQKGLASEHFKSLNKIISFPTSIFFGKDGMVKRIHTGFNGPGTGEYYNEYVQKTNSLIEGLLAD